MGRDQKLKAVPKPEPPPDPLTVATRLDPGDLAYHRFLGEKFQREEADRNASIQAWSEYLSKRYQLGAKDQVTPDGRITRTPEAAE